MAKFDIDKTISSNLDNVFADYSIEPQNTDGASGTGETYWINNKWDFSERESINEVSIFPTPHSCPFY